MRFCVLSSNGPLVMEIVANGLSASIAPGQSVTGPYHYAIAVDGEAPFVLQTNATLSGSAVRALVLALRRGSTARVSLTDAS